MTEERLAEIDEHHREDEEFLIGWQADGDWLSVNQVNSLKQRFKLAVGDRYELVREMEAVRATMDMIRGVLAMEQGET